jgi:hypothetical protein
MSVSVQEKSFSMVIIAKTSFCRKFYFQPTCKAYRTHAFDA